jgi:hypothetical protein
LYCLAAVEVDDAHLAAARPYLREAVALGQETGADADLAESLELTARVLALTAPATAAVLLATVDGLRESIGFARGPAEVGAHDALLAQVGSAEAVELDAAVQLALDELSAQ